MTRIIVAVVVLATMGGGVAVAAQAADGPVAAYLFDDGALFEDFTGSARTLTGFNADPNTGNPCCDQSADVPFPDYASNRSLDLTTAVPGGCCGTDPYPTIAVDDDGLAIWDPLLSTSDLTIKTWIKPIPSYNFFVPMQGTIFQAADVTRN